MIDPEIEKRVPAFRNRVIAIVAERRLRKVG
jgi:hypothetical protein